MRTDASTPTPDDHPEGGDHPEEHDPLLLAIARARGVTPANSKPEPTRYELLLEDGRKAPPGSGPTHGG